MRGKFRKHISCGSEIISPYSPRPVNFRACCSAHATLRLYLGIYLLQYVFSQLFSRNAVYKTICELCGIRASRRGSVDPTFENGYDIESDYENDSHNTLFPASQNKNGSISSSNSSSSPPEIRVRKKYAAFSKRLNRVLSVVQEGEGSHSDNDTDATRCIVRFTPSFSRSVSYIQDGSSATMQQYTVSHNETVIGQWLIKLFSSM